MKKKLYKKYIIGLGVFIFITALVFIASISEESTREDEFQNTQQPVKTSSLDNNLSKDIAVNTSKGNSSIFLIINGVEMRIPLIEGETLYDLLKLAKKNGDINFNGKDYQGLGFFVTDIGDLHQKDGKYLMYYVNQKETSTGISNYVPKNNDLIEWKLK